MSDENPYAAPRTLNDPTHSWSRSPLTLVAIVAAPNAILGGYAMACLVMSCGEMPNNEPLSLLAGVIATGWIFAGLTKWGLHCANSSAPTCVPDPRRKYLAALRPRR